MVWEWRTWEHLDPVADGIAEVQAPRTLWAQGNSVEELPDGDILASFRPTSTVVRISRRTGEIVWKMGPPTVAGQHAPTMLGNGNVLIFDNGVHRLDDSMPYSRVIEINPVTNEIVWKYQDKPAWNFFSPRMGNAQRLSNGNTLITEFFLRPHLRDYQGGRDRLGIRQPLLWRTALRWSTELGE